MKLSIEILRNPESYKKTISNNGKPSAEFGRKFIDGTIVVAEVETAEDGTVAIKSVWKKTPGRIDADGTIYLNRTSENTAEVLNSISSNDLIVKPDTVSKVIDENGDPLVVYHGTVVQIEESSLNQKTIRRELNFIGMVSRKHGY